ncbi:MAG: GxxExxY protein [Opitutaceae bacterium]|jgi:GxxExxY protein
MILEQKALTERIIGLAIEVHKNLGPGLLESAYEECLAYELSRNALRFERQKALPLSYKELKLDFAYRLDLVIENTVLIELKACDALSPIHEAQIIIYLKLSKLPVALLINFNVQLLRQGIRRFASTEPISAPSAPQR